MDLPNALTQKMDIISIIKYIQIQYSFVVKNLVVDITRLSKVILLQWGYDAEKIEFPGNFDHSPVLLDSRVWKNQGMTCDVRSQVASCDVR